MLNRITQTLTIILLPALLIIGLLAATQAARADNHVVTNANDDGPGSLRQAIADTTDNGSSQHLEVGQTPTGLSTVAWESIQTQIVAGKYRAYASEDGGYVSANPAQGWQIVYGADGVTTLTPRDDAGWSWGLQLRGYGYGADLSNFRNPKGLTADKTILTYTWDANLSEWWANSPAGLEQGFTLQERPGPSHGQPLRLEMVVRGALNPMPLGETIAFLSESGVTALTYGHLRVTDANGQVIPARLSLSQKEGAVVRVHILVEDAHAAYPLTIDPWAQQAYLKASNTEEGDLFGCAVAISGDTAVVGALSENSSATGVNGNQSDNSALDSGAAYIFTRSGTTWSQQAYLKASNTESNDWFGSAVAISGDTVVVGASHEGNSSGAAYVFTRSGTTWSQQAYLKASNTEEDDLFGSAVAVSGDTVVVGAFGEKSNAIGVNGNQSDNSATLAGAAYVFTRSGTTWSQQAYLKASNTESNDLFGYAVAISGDTVVVGAFYEASSATGVNGNQSDNSARDAGAAYVFTRSGTTWSQQAYLKASNTESNDLFGYAVAISDDTVVVGASKEAAYIFTRSGTTWSQQTYLKASNTEAGDSFGSAVAVSGDTVVVGASGEKSNATGVNGNQSDNSTIQAGAAYVFTRSGITWSQQAYLKASNTGAGDLFGTAVAVSGDTVVVGASGENSNATGVNGNQSDYSANRAGAAYVFAVVNPDLAIVKTVNPASIVSGQAITYTLTFSNTGGTTATGVVITDAVPISITNTSVVSNGAAITVTGTTSAYVWQVQDLVPGHGGIITLTGVLSERLAAGVFTNTATITGLGDGDTTNNHAAAGILVLTLPEVVMLGNNQIIADGDTTPSVTDNTDFGNVSLGQSLTRTFTISNSGTGDLLLTGSPAVSLTGAGVGSFSVVAQPAASVGPYAATTFQVRFTSSVVGTRVATVTIANDDSDENPYDFAIQGMGVNQPPVANAGSDQSVSVGALVTLNGAASADSDGHTPLTYGWTQTGGPTVSFTRNLSVTTFTVPGSPAILTFTLVVTDSLGLTDPTPDEVVITVTGTPGYTSSPAVGSTINFDSVAVGAPVTTTLTISETGNTTLNITSHSLSGANASDFTVTPLAPLAITDGGAAQTLYIRCVPQAGGLRMATLTVDHDAPGSPATYTLNCTGVVAAYLPIILKNVAP